MELPLWSYPVVFSVGVIAGGVDAIAGGGGIITLPVLLNLGLPVPLALGTNKLQATFGSLNAAWHYSRAGLVEIRSCRIGILATLCGALLGAWSVQRLSSATLQEVVPWMLGGIVLYALFRPKVGQEDRPPRLGADRFFVLFGLGLGFYDGFLGPGTGSFWTIALVTLLGFNFLRATATTKVMNATSNGAALGLFLAGGDVDFRIGLLMGAGQWLGSRLGAHLALTRGARFVRPIFLTMVTVVVARLLWTRYARQ